MLRGIRTASSNWLGRIVMGVVMTVLAGSFAVWGINDIFHGSSHSYVAKIGDREISVDEYRQAYNERLQILGQQIGHPLTPDEANAFGLPRQVLADLVARAGLDQMAYRMRLAVSDAVIVQTITGDPHFQSNGQFNRATFDNFLRNIGYSEQRFMAEQRQIFLRRQITESIVSGIVVPPPWFDAVNQFQNQQRSIAYVALGPEQAGDVPQPTPDELAKYFEDRKILFRAPEYRKIATVSLTPAELAKSIEVSDDDVKRAYEKDISRYTTPERRHVEQIVFPNIQEAQAASDRIKSGATFDAVAGERGLKPADIDLGMVSKSQIIDPAVADAAFALKQGEVSAPVQGRFGAVLVTVLEITAGETKPLAVVAPFIRNDLALERARAQVQDVHDKIEDARGGGSTIQEAAQKLNLPVVTYDAVDRSGRDPSGKPITGLPHAPEVINAAFNSDVGVDNDPISVEGGYIWYDVAGITPAHDRTLDEVKSQVEQRWHDDEVAKRLKAKATELLDKLKAGEPLDALAAANGLKVQTAADLKRGANPAGTSGRMVEAVFHIAKDGFGTAQGDTPAQWIVFHVTDVKTPAIDPNSPDGKKLDQLLQQQMSEDLTSQYVAWVENELGTSVDQKALAQALGTGSPGEE